MSIARKLSLCLCVGLVTTSFTAYADDDEDEEEEVIVVERAPKKKKKVVVVVNEDGTPASRPRVGDDPSEIKAYMASLKSDIRSLKRELKDARRSGEDADQIRAELVAANDLYKSERGRLMTTRPGFIAGGAVLVAAGGGALIGSIVLACIAANETRNDGYVAGALGLMAGGLLAIGGGIPLLAVGARPVPRTLDDAWIAPTLQIGSVGATGFGPSFRTDF